MAERPEGALHPTRATFLSGQEVLSRIRDALEVIRERSEPLLLRGPSDDPLRRTAAAIERERRRIVETLADFERTAPAAAIEQTVQFSAEFPAAILDPAGMRDLEDVVSWMVAVIERLSTLFDQLSRAAPDPAAEHVHARLRDGIRAHGRRVARLSGAARDLGMSPGDGTDADAGTGGDREPA